MRPTAIIVVLLAGCTTSPSVWMRTDGQSGRTNPALAQQFKIDQTICRGETQRAKIQGGPIMSNDGWAQLSASLERGEQARDVERGCMAQHGYMLVPAREAEKRAAPARAITADSQANR